jgi:hypothetical protein
VRGGVETQSPYACHEKLKLNLMLSQDYNALITLGKSISKTNKYVIEYIMNANILKLK